MTKRKASRLALTRAAEPLYREIRAVLESARAGAYRAVNAAMVQAYWQVGRLIVEHEQKGRRRAGYGEAVIATLAERLARDMGTRFRPTQSAVHAQLLPRALDSERTAFRIASHEQTERSAFRIGKSWCSEQDFAVARDS